MIYDLLTKKEKQVLDLVCKGFNDIEIAKNIGVSINTIRTHYENLCEKYQVYSSVKRTRLVIKRFKELGFKYIP